MRLYSYSIPRFRLKKDLLGTENVVLHLSDELLFYSEFYEDYILLDRRYVPACPRGAMNLMNVTSSCMHNLDTNSWFLVLVMITFPYLFRGGPRQTNDFESNTSRNARGVLLLAPFTF